MTVTKPKTPSVRDMTDAQLADAHRGFTFAKKRAVQNLQDIEAELERRGVTSAKGAQSYVEKKLSLGLIDLPRLRAARPEIVTEFAQAGSQALWASRTLRPDEKA